MKKPDKEPPILNWLSVLASELCVCVLALEVYVCSSIRNVCVLASEVSVPASELSVSQYSSIILEGESRNVVSNYFFWRAFYLEMLDERL